MLRGAAFGHVLCGWLAGGAASTALFAHGGRGAPLVDATGAEGAPPGELWAAHEGQAKIDARIAAERRPPAAPPSAWPST